MMTGLVGRGMSFARAASQSGGHLRPFPDHSGCFPSSAACSCSLLTPPEDVAVLKHFYLQVRPWGFWRPIHELVAAEDS